MTDPTELKDPTESPSGRIPAPPRHKKKRLPDTANGAAKSLRQNQPVISNASRRTKSLVHNIANGMTIAEAGRAAGYPLLDRPELERRPSAAYQEIHRGCTGVREMVAAERAETARDNKITRAMVIEGLKEAVDMSRMIGEPAIMVAAWREIGKMCGFYEPVKINIDLTTGGASLQTRITTMSDADLLRLAAGARLNEQGEVVEGTCERVDGE